MTKPALALLLISAFFGCAHQAVEPSETTPAPNTARAVLGIATTFAQAHDTNARLMSLSGLDVEPDGTSDTWRFKFRTFTPEFHDYYLHAASGGAILDSTANRPTVGDAFVTQPWCNSDEAMAVAEAHGGAIFRIANPHTTIRMGLGEAVLPDPQTEWYITYRSSDDASKQFNLRINATTKVVERTW